MMHRSILTLALLAAAFTLPAPADAGCMAVGYGGTVLDSRCTYTASDDTDWVFGTGAFPAENYWFISVRRVCPVFQTGCTPVRDALGCDAAPGNTCAQTGTVSRDVVLADGNGPITEQPFAVHPRVGETVTVELTTFNNGPYGFISVGEYDEVFESLPLP